MKCWRPLTLTLALITVSCADKKSKDETTPSDESLAPLMQSEARTALEIDATHRTDWVGLDLDQGLIINAADFPGNKGWDLAFKRTTIRLGDSVGMQVVNQDYASLTLAPEDGYVADQPAAEPGAPETAGLAFHIEPSWFAYDMTTHAVSSRGLSYAIKSSEGRVFKFRIIDYYNAARLPAYMNIEFQELKGVTP